MMVSSLTLPIAGDSLEPLRQAVHSSLVRGGRGLGVVRVPVGRASHRHGSQRGDVLEAAQLLGSAEQRPRQTRWPLANGALQDRLQGASAAQELGGGLLSDAAG